jgi:site-specific DNA-methyltransferase (adenine-specific)
VIHDGSAEVEEAFAAFGEKTSGSLRPEHQARAGFAHPACYHAGSTLGGSGSWDANSGSASRFFYSAKADKADRAGSKHPTVKPTDLMRYLVQLVTPPGGTVLDPFAGSGSTGLAADQLGMNAVLIERDPEYAADIERKITGDAPLFADVAVAKAVAVKDTGPEQLGMFGDAA